MESQNRFVWVDFLRIVGALSVIIIHLSAELVTDYDQTGTFSWWYANSLSAASRWAVPVFIMISGYLLLNPRKQEELGLFFKKRFTKIGIPLVFWSGLYLWWGQFANGMPLSPEIALNKMVLGNPYYHLYFLFVMVGLYLMTPILKVYLAHSHRKNIIYLLVLSLSLPTIVTILNYWYPPAYIHKTAFTQFLYYFGYFLLGYYVRTVEWKGKKLIAGFIGLLLSIGFTAIGTYFLIVSSAPDATVLYFYSYFSPNVFVMSLFVFILFKSCNRYVIGFAKIFGLIAPVTFGIYLIHPLLINVLQHGVLGYSVTVHTVNRVVGLTVTTVVVFILSFVIVYIGRKIPFVNKIFG